MGSIESEGSCSKATTNPQLAEDDVRPVGTLPQILQQFKQRPSENQIELKKMEAKLKEIDNGLQLTEDAVDNFELSLNEATKKNEQENRKLEKLEQEFREKTLMSKRVGMVLTEASTKLDLAQMDIYMCEGLAASIDHEPEWKWMAPEESNQEELQENRNILEEFKKDEQEITANLEKVQKDLADQQLVAELLRQMLQEAISKLQMANIEVQASEEFLKDKDAELHQLKKKSYQEKLKLEEKEKLIRKMKAKEREITTNLKQVEDKLRVRQEEIETMQNENSELSMELVLNKDVVSSFTTLLKDSAVDCNRYKDDAKTNLHVICELEAQLLEYRISAGKEFFDEDGEQSISSKLISETDDGALGGAEQEKSAEDWWENHVVGSWRKTMVQGASVDASPGASVDASPGASVDASPGASVDASPGASAVASPGASEASGYLKSYNMTSFLDDNVELSPNTSVLDDDPKAHPTHAFQEFRCHMCCAWLPSADALHRHQYFLCPCLRK